jgi:C4-dicarboxylate-specific signal transduction histidine kinase
MMPKNRRTWLWLLLLLLIAMLLGSLIWLVGRYEQSRFEDQLELTATDLASDIRAKLARNAQRLHVLLERETPNWQWTAKELLEQQPEILRIERRSPNFNIQALRNSAFLSLASKQDVFGYFGRQNFSVDVVHSCALAARSLEPAYSISYFVPQSDGTGFEVTDMCIPSIENNKVTGYLVTTYSLDRILKEWGEASIKRQEEISFREADGARLAVVGSSSKSGNKFAVQTVLQLQGIALILRIESWRSAPYWLANTPTALALALVLALVAVLWLLYRDTRKRIRTEAKLAREIIQQRRAEEISRQSLERLQKSARLATLGEMASMLSHELNQPLAAIASYASGSLNLLPSDANGVPSQQDISELKIALERIATQSARAGQVIKSVHGFVRRRETERSFVQPQALLDAVLPLLGLQAKQLGIRISIQVEPQLPAVWCDTTLVEQVLINLARNGMQAMDSAATPVERRRLTLVAKASKSDATQDTHAVEFQVMDQGPGLTQEVALRLFTPFFTTKEEGMGLGLSLCRTVIEQHGSSLIYTTNTEPPRTGTTFRFKLTPHHDQSNSATA